MKALLLLLLFIVAGCNSEQASMSAIQGMRDPSGPQPIILNIVPPPDRTYTSNETLTFIVNFSEPVTVLGSPQIPFMANIGGLLQARYESGSGTSSLIFRHELSYSQDLDGINVGNFIDLNLGNIFASDGTSAILSFMPPLTSGVLIDSLAPKIIAISSTQKLYKSGDLIRFKVTYNAPVKITDGGTSYVKVDVAGEEYDAYLESNSVFSSDLFFSFNVGSGLLDLDGITFKESSLRLMSGTIQDNLGNTANNTLAANAFPGVNVDSVLPTAISISLPTDKTYYKDEVLSFILRTDKDVTVNGTPRLTINTNSGGPVFAIHKLSPDRRNHIFEYAVGPNVSDTDGINIEYAIETTNGTFTDAAGNQIEETWYFTINSSGIKIDSLRPHFTQPTPAFGYKKNDEFFDVEMIPNEPLFLSNVDTTNFYLNLTGGFKATYLSHSATSIKFRYIVEPLKQQSNIFVTSINLGTTQIKDGTAANANEFDPIKNFPFSIGTIIDSKPPVINAILPLTVPAFKVGTAIELKLVFDEAVIPPNTSDFVLKNNQSTPITLNYNGVESSNVLKYKSTNYLGPIDMDGLEANTPNLNGSPVTDLAGNPAGPLPTGVYELFIVPSSMTSWYDANKKYTIGTSSPIDQYQNLVESSLTASGGSLTVDDVGGKKFIKMNNGSLALGNKLLSHLYLVYKTPAALSTTLYTLFNFGTTNLMYSSSGSSLNCSVCYYWEGFSYKSNTNYSDILSGRMKLTHIKYQLQETKALTFPMSTVSMGEVMTFDGNFSSIEEAEINTYLGSKYSGYFWDP